jgi:hypothetical protein
MQVLLLAEHDANGHAVKSMLAHAIFFQVARVVGLHVLRQVAEEHKTRKGCGRLRGVPCESSCL